MDNESIVEKDITDILHFLLINVIIYGLIGNFLCYKVFSTPKLKKYPITVYFRSISVFDSIMMLNALIYFLNQKYSWDLSLLNDFFCKMRNYFLYSTGSISSWIIVFVSFDRFLFIAFPKKFQLIRKFIFQISVVAIIASYNYILYSFMAWESVLILGKYH